MKGNVMAKIIEGKKIIFPICNTFATVEFLEPFDAWKKIWKGKKTIMTLGHLFIYVTVGLNLTKNCDFGKTTLYLLGWKEKLFFIFIAHYICEHWMYKSAKKIYTLGPTKKNYSYNLFWCIIIPHSWWH